jgi:hypothetical protein
MSEAQKTTAPTRALRRLRPAIEKLHAHRLDGTYDAAGRYMSLHETDWWGKLTARDRARAVRAANRFVFWPSEEATHAK